jgi:DNA mismatch repair protein MutS
MENATPMLRQYLEIKRAYPGTLLFFRLGDFYELFNEDAVTGSRELGITLTARQKDSVNPIPMCGVPYHAASSYIARLVKKGYRVAICEQAEPSGKGTKLVKREVVRVITPGTAIDDQLTEPRTSVYLAACFRDGETAGLALLELSTGSFFATQLTGPDLEKKIDDVMGGYRPAEIVIPESFHALSSDRQHQKGDLDSSQSEVSGSAVTTPIPDEHFHRQDCEKVLLEHFGVRTLDGYGLGGRDAAVCAAGAVLRYAKDTQKTAAAHIADIQFFDRSDCLVLDATTLKNLELIDSRSGSPRHCLFQVIDSTITGMGARLLKAWLLRPLLRRSEIQTRLSAVEELGDHMLREKIRHLLKHVSDLERLVGRLNLGNATARDLLGLRRTLGNTPQLKAALTDSTSLLLQVLGENIFDLPEISQLIDRSISDDPPANLHDGGTIKDGFDNELDGLRDVSRSAKQTIAGFEESERARTGISSLKIRFNNVFGYYIEVSKTNLNRVPSDYERRQTLANAERFTTPVLKEWETKVIGAEDRILKVEADLFDRVRNAVKAETKRLQATARALATVDALQSLADVAVRNNYVMPALHDGDEIEIKAGRHPIVEAAIGDRFVPNDVYLNNSTDRLLIVTGANMGGKSTILRQVALIQVLAQVGSFVPASAARLPVVDRIWTRVGASDDLASGRSTFMVEMVETAAILRNATPRSLVLLDEIGRGTSTFDGLSIAWAVAEYLHDSPEHCAKTLFATHYHELTELAEKLPGGKNYSLAAAERDGEVVFLHRLEKGKASKSYGIAVAGLAGFPAAVLERAKDVLGRLEKYELAVFADEKKGGLAAAASSRVATQVSLFAVANEAAIEDLRTLDPDALTPEESRELLRNIKERII